MSFFRPSFSNLGEALKTISLAIALLGTLLSGAGYVYGTLAAQEATANELIIVNQRLGAIEKSREDADVWKYRIEQTEKGVKTANEKLDAMGNVLNEVARSLNSLNPKH